MPNTIHCPSCNRELRVPDDLLGKKVKCPACSTTFTASVAGPEPATQAAPAPLVLQESEPSEPARRRPVPDEQVDEGGAYDQDYEPSARPPSARRSRGLAVMRAPAICLMVSAVLSLLVVGYFLIVALVVTEGQMDAQMRLQNPNQTQQERDMAKKMIGMIIGPGPAVFHLLFIGVNLVIILGSIMMLIGKMRWLAVMGSVLAILNIDCICCLLGIPFGIWSLIALNNPDAKSAFQ
jgi:predicted Zn finger-like uncharacterized protein